MKTMTCDFLIVGAGLSGCTLGVLLARAGADVLALELLDAKEKDKPCAGGIDRNLRSLLEETFGRGAWDDLHPAHIDGMRFRMDGHELRGGSRFCALPRKQLDDYALNLYTEAGGRLMDRVSVKAIDAAKGEAACECLRTGEPFTVQFRTVVGADGAASCARRLITGKKASAAPALVIMAAMP